MTNILHHNKYPRKLTSLEKKSLFAALPVNKSGYYLYRKKIEELIIVGDGRFGNGNIILGSIDSKIDLAVSSMPIFAFANSVYEGFEIYSVIHEEQDGMVEVDIKISTPEIPGEISLLEVKTYSEWAPGMKDPFDNSVVREVDLENKTYVLSISPNQKKIWIHNSENGVNYFVPVSNFYVDIMKTMNIKDPKIALDPNRLFRNLDQFKDEELKIGFVKYNNSWRKVVVDELIIENKIDLKKNKTLFNFWKK